jgi:hypothetical protein
MFLQQEKALKSRKKRGVGSGAGAGSVIQCADPRIQICIKRVFLILLLILEVKLEITVCALTGSHIYRSTGQRSTCYTSLLKESDKHNNC